MSSFRVRPRFEHTLEFTPQETRERILRSLAAQNPTFEVKALPEFIGIHFAAHERRYWSPRLFLGIEATDAGTTRIEGIYGPEIEIWSVFLYGYLLTGLLGTFSGILGGAQLFVGSEPWGLWITGSMAVIACLLYLGAQFGQKLGAWQTFQLHQAYQNAIGRPTEIQ
jgi:hypothetical protein